MDASVQKRPIAWQPLTPAGVAAFANASLNRLLLVQLIFALVAASAVVWFLAQNWFPVITRAAETLPTQGEIKKGMLQWPGQSPDGLADNVFLSLAVDLDHSGAARIPAHVQVEFGRTNVKLFSLFGFWKFSYPSGWRMAFNRVELTPWWGAWAPPLLGIAAVTVMVGLLFCWAILATIYVVPAWLMGLFANRIVSLRSCWRLAGAALMPGALFLSGAIFAYGVGALDVVRLITAVGIHLIIGWAYVVAGALALPRDPSADSARANPFARPGVEEPRNK